MSFGYPAVRPQHEGSQSVTQPDGAYGIPDQMINGFHNVHDASTESHPLEFSEKNWNSNKDRMDFAMLRNIQGIHAPLKLQMERNVAKKMQRLPGMASSNMMLDTLQGKDISIGFEDILNNPSEAELIGQPHVMMERRMNLL